MLCLHPLRLIDIKIGFKRDNNLRLLGSGFPSKVSLCFPKFLDKLGLRILGEVKIFLRYALKTFLNQVCYAFYSVHYLLVSESKGIETPVKYCVVEAFRRTNDDRVFLLLSLVVEKTGERNGAREGGKEREEVSAIRTNRR